MVGIAQVVPWALTEKIIDKERHYVLLKGRFNSCRLIIAGVYAPNTAQAPFGEVIFKELSQNRHRDLLLGDFNAILDKYQERSKASSTPSIPDFFFFLLYKESLG